MTQPAKKGRPKAKQNRDTRKRINVDISHETHAKLEKLRVEWGVSFGRIVDCGVDLLRAPNP